MQKKITGLLAMSLALSLSLIFFTDSAQAAPKQGSPCGVIGKQIKNSVGFLECRKIAGNKLVNFQLSNNPKAVLGQNSPEDISTCRVADMRTSKTIGGAIAYPATQAGEPIKLPSIGTAKVAVIPIDFPDVQGKNSPDSISKPFMKTVDAWLAHFSNGKLKYEWQTSSKWIRASQTSDQYVWLHPGGSATPRIGAYTPPKGIEYKSASSIAENLMADAQNSFDYSGLNIVFFIYPPNVKNIWDAMTQFGQVNTNKGQIHLQISSVSEWTWRDKVPVVSTFIHENMHPTGLAGHAPYNGSPFSIMSTDSGTLVLNAWETSILDWQITDQIYCISAENVSKNTVTLSPIDRNNGGTKAVFVKVNDHTTLVFESRRRDFWSSSQSGIEGFNKGFYGIVGYRINTTIDKNRVNWSPSSPNGEGGYADFIINSRLKHGQLTMRNIPSLSADVMLYEGDSEVSDGIKVTLVKSGDNDTIQIEKVSKF